MAYGNGATLVGLESGYAYTIYFALLPYVGFALSNYTQYIYRLRIADRVIHYPNEMWKVFYQYR